MKLRLCVSSLKSHDFYHNICRRIVLKTKGAPHCLRCVLRPTIHYLFIFLILTSRFNKWREPIPPPHPHIRCGWGKSFCWAIFWQWGDVPAIRIQGSVLGTAALNVWILIHVWLALEDFMELNIFGWFVEIVICVCISSINFQSATISFKAFVYIKFRELQ